MILLYRYLTERKGIQLVWCVVYSGLTVVHPDQVLQDCRLRRMYQCQENACHV
jgi:hypothetical protein